MRGRFGTGSMSGEEKENLLVHGDGMCGVARRPQRVLWEEESRSSDLAAAAAPLLSVCRCRKELFLPVTVTRPKTCKLWTMDLDIVCCWDSNVVSLWDPPWT